MLDLISLGAIALYLNLTDISLSNFSVTPLNWQQAKGRHYESTYEREATGNDRHTESDVEEIRRRSYEQRRQGYDDDYRDDYYRRDRTNDYDDYDDYSRRRRREILEEQKERIEAEIEALDDE